jgi:hypothetical protein
MAYSGLGTATWLIGSRTKAASCSVVGWAPRKFTVAHPGRVRVTSILVASAGWKLGVLVWDSVPLGDASKKQHHVNQSRCICSAFFKANLLAMPIFLVRAWMRAAERVASGGESRNATLSTVPPV